MKDDFFKADGGGDPSSFNNGLWFFGHPFVWLVIFLWLIIFIAAVKLATRLWRQKKFIWFFAFVIIASSALAYYVYLSKNAHGLYAEGINEGSPSLSRAKILVLILSFLSVFWIILDWVKKRRT